MMTKAESGPQREFPGATEGSVSSFVDPPARSRGREPMAKALVKVVRVRKRKGYWR
jgi:hypothetical protein